MNAMPDDNILPTMIQSRWDRMEGSNISLDVQSTSSVARLEQVHLIFRLKVKEFGRMREWYNEGTLDIKVTAKAQRWLRNQCLRLWYQRLRNSCLFDPR